MAQENQDIGLIRRYLLGQLSEDELRRLEEKMMADNEFFNLVLVTEDEIIEEFVQGELPEIDRGVFEASFLSTQEGRQQISYAKALRKYVHDIPRPVWRRPHLVPYLRLAAAAVIVLAIGLVTWPLFIHFRHSQVSKGVASLRDTYRDQRPTEARISDFNYAPPPQITQGPERDRFDYLALDRAKALIQVEANEHPSAQSYHDLGRLYLAQHDFDKAIDQLKKAIELDGKNARLHSDLGAAFLEKGKAERRNGESTSPETFAQGLTHLNQACDLDPSLLEALFNRALCRQELKLFDQASKDWREYLEKDPNSKWADEAKLKLEELEARKPKAAKREDLLRDFLAAYELKDEERAWAAFSQSRFRTGNSVTESLIEAYLNSSAQRRIDEAGREIDKVAYAGSLETEKVSDRFTVDLAQFYKHSSPILLRDLRQARRLMASADSRSREAEYEQAIKLYSKARILFEGAGDSCESIFAEVWVGISTLRIAPRESLRVLEPLVPALEDKSYKYLLTMCLNGIADAQFSQRELTKSLEVGNRAYETAQQIGDLNGMLRNLTFQVAMQQQYGEYNKSLVSIFRAFDLASTFSPDPKEIWAYYHQAASNYYSLGQLKTALDFQTEAMHLATETGLPLYKSRSYAQAGLILGKLKEYDDAINNLQLALAEGQRIVGHKGGFNLVANSTLSLAHLYQDRGDLMQALAYYDSAIELHKKLDIEIYVLQAHQGRLLSLIGLKDDKAAQQEMETAIAMVEQYRPKILEEASRNAFFDLAQSVYDIAIDYSYSRMNSPSIAYDYAEASHARSLLDLMHTSSQVLGTGEKQKTRLSRTAFPKTLSEIERKLSVGTQVIMYSVLDERLVIWVISSGRCECKESKITAGELKTKVRDFVDLVKESQSSLQEITARGTELYDLLVAPIEGMLNPGSYLCIVPDKDLNYLPFCSLVSSKTGKYFVEERVFGLAPSSTIFLSCSDNARRTVEQSDERFLIVANPTQDLAPTEHEANAVSGFYKFHTPLIGLEAIKSRVKTEMMKADVVEFASHYVTDTSSPMRSKLLLAKGGGEGDDGDLAASEVYDMKLPRTRLVLLTACQTGVEQTYRGEGAIGMARAFIKAGVPIVVASFWPVEARATSALMISFHKHRSQGASTTEALRRAQVDMLESSNGSNQHPYSWAAFAAIGGYTTF